MNIFIVCVAYGDISIHSATIETSKSILSTVVEYIDDEQIDLYKSVVERKWEENCSDIHKIHKICFFSLNLQYEYYFLYRISRLNILFCFI